MTIDEAIWHAKEVSRTCGDGQCAADHMQLVEWLRRARGAGKAARWYTAKIRELENRGKALETLNGEKEAENAKLRELVRDLERARSALCNEYPNRIDVACDECSAYDVCNANPVGRMRELGIEVDE